MTDEDRIAAATHAIQTGVKTNIELDCREGKSVEHMLKHIRTGVDAGFASQLGLAELLIAKGVFTKEEYTLYVADAYELEVKRYEAALSKRMGKRVSLR